MIISYLDLLTKCTTAFFTGKLKDEDFDRMRILTMWRDNDRRRARTIEDEYEYIETINSLHN
jgi:hypothetical protein